MLARQEQIRSLSERIRQLEQSRCRPHRQSDVAHDSATLLRLLGHRELPNGCLIEWLAEGPGAGLATLAWMTLQSLRREAMLVVIDSRREFYAPSVIPLGVDLRRIVWLRPQTTNDALWALEQTLRTREVGGVLCDIERFTANQFRRIQLAAEAGETCGMLLRPVSVRRQPTWAEARLLVTPQPLGNEESRRWRVEVLRAKGRFSGNVIQVELSHGPDGLCVAAELASATPAA